MTPSISERYRRFAEIECHEYAPLYAALARGVSEDAFLLGFLSAQPDPQPNLLFAAVQLLAGHDGMPRSVGALSDFVWTYRERVGEVMRARRTQTNEVGRCALLLPALPRGPLGLLEVGASAGLCLLLDRYRFQYGDAQTGIADSPVRIECEPVGKASIPIPSTVPHVVWRRGLDLNPVDLGNADDAGWLSACVWVDHPDRRRRLNAAIAVAESDRPLVYRGDLVDDLGAHLDEIPADVTSVVFHSAVLPYVSLERRNQFFEVLKTYSERREIVLISIESPGVIPALEPRPLVEDRRSFRVDRTIFSGGRWDSELLGIGHPHGRSLEWFQPTG